MSEYRFVVNDEQEDERIDKLCAQLCPEQSRSFIQKLIKDAAVLVNGKAVKPSYSLKEGDKIVIDLPPAMTPDIPAEDIPLDIVYEDTDLLVVNKPKGMVVHPAPGHYNGTLVNALMYHCHDLSGINGVMRPGIVHRIDRDTSGLLVICKNDSAHRSIAEQLKEHSIERIYQAICLGRLKDIDGTVDAPIGRDPNERKRMAVHNSLMHAKSAVTHYHVIEQFEQYAHISCRLETGRTHQIRVHMAHIGHPLLGDEVYNHIRSNIRIEEPGQVLHAGVLGFVHPSSGEKMHFEAPLPGYFQNLLKKLKK